MSGRIAWLKRLSTLYRLVAPHCLRAFFRHRPFVFQIYGFILFNFPRSQPAFAHFSTLKPDNLLRKKKKKEEDSQIIFKKKKVAYLYNIIYIRIILRISSEILFEYFLKIYFQDQFNFFWIQIHRMNFIISNITILKILRSNIICEFE